MMHALRPLMFCLALYSVLVWAGCTTAKQPPATPPVLGTWTYTMDNPAQGTITGTMILAVREDGTYTGHVKAIEIGIDETLVVKTLDLDGPAFTMRGWLTGMELVLEGTVNGNTITGTNQVIGMDTFAFTAQRVMEE